MSEEFTVKRKEHSVCKGGYGGGTKGIIIMQYFFGISDRQKKNLVRIRDDFVLYVIQEY